MELSIGQRRIVRAAAWSVAAGLVIVPALLGAAMTFFPGGHAGVADGYSFHRHVLSDLGRCRLGNGSANVASRALFTTAMCFAGTVLAVFWTARSFFLSKAGLARVVRICGLLMSACMACIGLAPTDRAPALHDPVTGAAAAAAACAALALLADRNDRLEPRASKRSWLIALLAVATGWTAMVLLHRARILPFRPWLPIGQKALVASFIAWMAAQALALRRATR
jgi:hypothetical membrane protein